MTYRKYLIASAVMTVGMLGASTAQASYMSDCNALISKWENCTKAGQSCTTEFKTIEKECKCHRLQQGEWKLVMAAVGKDGVCAPAWPDEPVPDPAPPTKPTHKVGDPWNSDEEKKEDPRKKKGKAKPVTTYGGERAPGEQAPGHQD